MSSLSSKGNFVKITYKKGPYKLKTLNKQLTRKPAMIEELGNYFIIKIPLIQNTYKMKVVIIEDEDNLSFTYSLAPKTNPPKHSFVL